MARGSVMGRVPLLPTTVVGSYPVPEWMERLKTEYFRGRMSHAQLLDVPLAGNRPGVPSVDPGTSPAGYLPLDLFGVTPIPIGDEQFINFNVPAFRHAGQSWTRLGVVSDGYVVVGGATAEDVDCCNLPSGPDPGRPNNVLAPFWTDLDGTAAPGIQITVLTDTSTGSSWLVIEFRLNTFGTTDRQTFQTWIGINAAEDITYTYDPADPLNAHGMPFLVGAENLLGQGDMSATLPTGDLRVTSTDSVPGDVASYTVFVRGADAGTGMVTSSMNADGVLGTTIVTSNITVTPRSGAN